MEEKFDLMIIFTDGTGLIIDDVQNYRSCDEEYRIVKNGWYSFIPRANVMYLGRADSFRKEDRDRYDNFRN